MAISASHDNNYTTYKHVTDLGTGIALPRQGGKGVPGRFPASGRGSKMIAEPVFLLLPPGLYCHREGLKSSNKVERLCV